MLPVIFNSRSTDIDEFFNGFFGTPRSLFKNESKTFPVDVEETDTAYVVKADLPGLTKNDISISVEDGYLTIKAEKKHETKKDNDKVHYYERSYGSFERSFRVDDALDSSAIDACYKDGVLSVTIPKKEKAKGRSIEVR